MASGRGLVVALSPRYKILRARSAKDRAFSGSAASASRNWPTLRQARPSLGSSGEKAGSKEAKAARMSAVEEADSRASSRASLSLILSWREEREGEEFWERVER